MRFANAADGVRKLRIAQLLSVIFAIVTLLTLLLVLPDGNILKFRFLVILLGLSALVFSISILVLQLTGVSRAKRDERTFREAQTVLIVSLVIGVFQGIVSSLGGENSPIYFLLSLAGTALNIFSMYYIIQGISNLAVRLKDLELPLAGSRMLRLYIVVECSSILISILSKIMPNSDAAAMVLTGLGIGAAVFSLIAAILFYRYLARAERLLLTKRFDPEPSVYQTAAGQWGRVE